MSAVDHAFVKAISTIKAMSRAPNGLGRPPPESRTTLYGLYKQATEGDVQGIMPRPTGNTDQDEANRRKWDAWREHHGLTRAEAKLKYIEYLLETMRSVSTGAPEAQALLDDLDGIYQTAKSGGRGDSSAGGEALTSNHNRAWSLASNNSTYSQFLRRPTYSEFGLSVGDRTERMSERAMDFEPEPVNPNPALHIAPNANLPPGSALGAFAGGPANTYAGVEDAATTNSTWKQDVAWQLETITEEINSMRRRYGAPPTQPGNASRKPRDALPLPSGPPGPDPIAEWMKWLQVIGKAIASKATALLRRAAIDVAGLTLFLIIVRMVRNNPALLNRIPLTRRFFAILGDIIAVALREVGFDIRPRSVTQGTK